MVHAFHIVCSTEQAAEPQRVPFPSPAAVGSMAEAMPLRLQQALDPFGHRLPNQMIDAHVEEGRIVALYRITNSAPVEQVVERIQRLALADAAWATVSYHECNHDEGGHCGLWKEVLRIGEVPE